MSFHIFWPHNGLFMIIHPLVFHCSRHGVNALRNCPVQRVSSQDSWMIISQNALSSADWLLQFGLRFIPAGVNVGGNSGCGPRGGAAPDKTHLYPRHRREFPPLQMAAAGMGEGSIYCTRSSSTHISRNSGLAHRCPSAANRCATYCGSLRPFFTRWHKGCQVFMSGSSGFFCGFFLFFF